MITQQPLKLTASDLTETRSGNYHARWPRDPDTTRRLDAVRNHDLSTQTRPRYKLNPFIALLLAFLSMAGIVWLFIAIS